jgi:hypothetical protein
METYAWTQLSIVMLLEDAVAQSEAVPLEASASTDAIMPDGIRRDLSPGPARPDDAMLKPSVLAPTRS